MEEMMEESLDSVNDDEELEQEADEEVDKVLYELTDGKLGQAGRVGAELPVSRSRGRAVTRSRGHTDFECCFVPLCVSVPVLAVRAVRLVAAVQ
jgi:t-SNARE complex subunit (syntaxin)